jgi:hypothetical protein
MAIVQASLQEDILPRSERAVIRGIYHASQLSEALIALSKIEDSLNNKCNEAVKLRTHINFKESIDQMKHYLAVQIANALVSTKVPATKNADSIPQVQNPVT